MFYIPGVLKRLDGVFLERSLVRWHRTRGAAQTYDLVDAHFGYPDGVGAVRFARRLRVPAFVTVRGLETDYLRKNGISGQLVAALREAAGCICVSRSLRDLLIHHGVEPHSTRVIPNGVDRRMFRPGDKWRARAQLGLEAGRPLIVSVGTLIALKRHHVLLQAMQGVRKAFPTVDLVVIGVERDEPSYLPSLKRMARDLSLGDAVRFIGAVPPDRVSTWLQAADAFALATAREGCCNAVLESLASGIPVVTTPAGDNPLFVRDGENGYLVPVDDVPATERALVKVLQATWDPVAISRGLPVGSWEDVAHQVVEFFKETLAVRRTLASP
jgi:glycosyltransferase involved in cell wall biosynthesis